MKGYETSEGKVAILRQFTGQLLMKSIPEKQTLKWDYSCQQFTGGNKKNKDRRCKIRPRESQYLFIGERKSSRQQNSSEKVSGSMVVLKLKLPIQKYCIRLWLVLITCCAQSLARIAQWKCGLSIHRAGCYKIGVNSALCSTLS